MNFKLDFIGNKIWIYGKTAHKEADFVVIFAPTNYGSECVIELVMSVTSEALGIIKFTIPVGYTKNGRKKYYQ
ncbi:TPA: hypothetical protein RD613_001863 [Enterococcus faecium]|uniref:UDP-glucose 6-dehydrogenase n=1 Tax=Enterococcus faecium (strain ATCC BAA-472 / TX0016 / DO) TaxID=333849 RepID=Q3XZL5_ENTFD|nr:UDP-glucose 6-dehydrogenase [Enterococcus faecium DO]EAN09683.1 hypothetical protein EfaeDRAFT_1156 [Enterococcus faecium DO]HDT7938167.1 hypothetical protein [Enterococcus faecium]